MRVGEIIAEPLRVLRRTDGLGNRVSELLQSVELDPGIAHRFPHELSGGQRQRVAIARAIGPRPEVIVADEPLSALDMSVREQVVQLLRRLAAHESLTLVIVSHDLGIVQRLCRQTVVMNQGRIVEAGETLPLLANPAHPYTKQLISSIPEMPSRAEATP
jgi:peptide/nickel transport system ATP-binding protein